MRHGRPIFLRSLGVGAFQEPVFPNRRNAVEDREDLVFRGCPVAVRSGPACDFRIGLTLVFQRTRDENKLLIRAGHFKYHQRTSVPKLAGSPEQRCPREAFQSLFSAGRGGAFTDGIAGFAKSAGKTAGQLTG
jgi:hypothetical protein